MIKLRSIPSSNGSNTMNEVAQKKIKADCESARMLVAKAQATLNIITSYTKPNPAWNSYRGLLVNIPPDCGDPSKPHAYDPTCLHCR